MKIKLLKKLRKIYVIQERNNKYRVFENRECLGGSYNQTKWDNKETTIKMRRKWILKEARKYGVVKNTY